MTVQQFRDSMARDEPPKESSIALAALWWDAKGDWKRAHETAGLDEGPAAAWVHAYLHRKEGDTSNARYWYGRADRTPSTRSLDEEWSEITTALLS